MRTKDLPQIPAKIDIEKSFNYVNSQLVDEYKYGSLVAFKRDLRRDVLKDVEGNYLLAFQPHCLIEPEHQEIDLIMIDD